MVGVEAGVTGCVSLLTSSGDLEPPGLLRTRPPGLLRLPPPRLREPLPWGEGSELGEEEEEEGSGSELGVTEPRVELGMRVVVGRVGA